MVSSYKKLNITIEIFRILYAFICSNISINIVSRREIALRAMSELAALVRLYALAIEFLQLGKNFSFGIHVTKTGE